MRDPVNQVVDAVARATPPVAVTVSNFVIGVPVEKWLTFVMIIYTVLQIGLLVRDRVIRNKREGDKP